MVTTLLISFNNFNIISACFTKLTCKIITHLAATCNHNISCAMLINFKFFHKAYKDTTRSSNMNSVPCLNCKITTRNDNLILALYCTNKNFYIEFIENFCKCRIAKRIVFSDFNFRQIHKSTIKSFNISSIWETKHFCNFVCSIKLRINNHAETQFVFKERNLL